MLLIGRVSCCQKRWLMQDDGLLPMPKKYPPIIIYGFSILYGIKVPSSESSKIPREIHLFQIELLTAQDFWTLQTLPGLQPLTVCLDQPLSYTMSRFGTLAIYEWISLFNMFSIKNVPSLKLT